MNIPNEHLTAIRYGLELQVKSELDNDVKAKAQAALSAIDNVEDFEMKPLSDGIMKKTAFVTESYQQKARVMMFNVLLLLDQIYPREVWPGPPDYDNGDSGSVLVKQAWVAVEAFQKEIKRGNTRG